jgi:hypothetical protein
MADAHNRKFDVVVTVTQGCGVSLHNLRFSPVRFQTIHKTVPKRCRRPQANVQGTCEEPIQAGLPGLRNARCHDPQSATHDKER